MVHIKIINQRAQKRQTAYLKRLENYPLDKAEYYLRMKEQYGVISTRRLARILGEDWSRMSRILKVLDLASPIKEYLINNKHNLNLGKFFNLRRLLEIVRKGAERLQLAYFKEVMFVFEKSN